MANTQKTIKKTTRNTKMTLTRGYDSDKRRELIQDGEVFFDMNGSSILMGVFQGESKPIKVVEIATGGSGSGSISEEQLADLLSVKDIRTDDSTGVVYIGKVGSETAVASAELVNSLSVAVKNNDSRITTLEEVLASGISDAAKQYIQEVLVDANFSEDPSSPITVNVKESKEVTLDVITDNTIGKVTSADGNTSIGTVWAEYDGEKSQSGTIGKDDSNPVEDDDTLMGEWGDGELTDTLKMNF